MWVSGAEQIYIDKGSRNAFDKMIEDVKEGDTILVESNRRLPCDAKDLIDKLTEKQVRLVSMKD